MMGLIHIPQSKWGSGTGRQVILKSDFDKIEQALLEAMELTRRPPLEFVDSATVRVNATADCRARLLMCGFPSPLAPGQWLDAGLSDGRYRENAAPVTLNLATASHLWGTEKSNQWYTVYALAGAGEVIFSLKGMPVLRVSSQVGQTITLRNNANTADIGYGFETDELAGSQILILTGASRGLARAITANNADNGAGGTITYGGSALTLAQGDWAMVLPQANFCYLGMILNDGDGNLAPFYQEGGATVYQIARQLASGAINGYTLTDLGLAAPPTARELMGYAAATGGYELKLAISYDGINPGLILHGGPPSGQFQGVQGTLSFGCRPLAGHQIYLNNENTDNQTVNITGWRE